MSNIFTMIKDFLGFNIKREFKTAAEIRPGDVVEWGRGTKGWKIIAVHEVNEGNLRFDMEGVFGVLTSSAHQCKDRVLAVLI